MVCGRGGLAVLEVGEAQGEREIRREALGSCAIAGSG
jgi:hypothetical protein